MQETTKNKVNLFIIGGVFIAIGVAGFLYIKRDQSSDDLLTSAPSAVVQSPVNSTFLKALLELTQHKLDKSIFETKGWKSLRDFSKPLAPQDSGRPNPFAPVSTTSTPSRP